MKRRHSEPIRKYNKLTEHRRHTYSIFFKKSKTSSKIRIRPNQEIQVRIIYRDSLDSPRTIERNRTKRASVLVVATLAAVALSFSIYQKRKK